jgi:RNA-directed DNA polymerase
LLTTVSQALRTGTFQRGKVAKLYIPKDLSDPSRGTRTISMMSIVDRVVQRSITQILQPLFAPLFGTTDDRVRCEERVFGFRSRRGRMHALAVAGHFSCQQKRLAWVVEGLRDAFNHVPLGRLRDVLKLHVPCEKLVDLTIALVKTDNKNGIQQGGPLSPLLLNVYLHHFLDRVWQEELPEVPLLRYGDDLLLPCRTAAEAATARCLLKKILIPTGMALKSDDSKMTYRRLSTRKAVTWLGFRFSWVNKELQVAISDKAWSRLQEQLRLSHRHSNAPVRAIAIIRGWLSQMGPCYAFSQVSEVIAKVRTIACQEGFDELPGIKTLRTWWIERRDRWYVIRAYLSSPSKTSAAASADASSIQNTVLTTAEISEVPFDVL